jgi:L-threonylcarbamoyladenylate synthase
MYTQTLINITKNHLESGHIILYPTDTIWGIGCDATNNDAVKNIYSIKNRAESKSLILLVDSIEMLQNHIHDIPKELLEIINSTKKPTTIIYNNPVGIASKCISKDNTVAIRIVQDSFCKKLIKEFKKPVTSTSANISGSQPPRNFNEIDINIKKKVDYIVKLKLDKIMDKASRIIKFAKNTVHIIRE